MSSRDIVWIVFGVVCLLTVAGVGWGLRSSRTRLRRGETLKDRYARESASLHSVRNVRSMRAQERRAMWSAGAGIPIAGYGAGSHNAGHSSGGCSGGCGGGAGCGGGGGCSAGGCGGGGCGGGGSGG